MKEISSLSTQSRIKTTKKDKDTHEERKKDTSTSTRNEKNE